MCGAYFKILIPLISFAFLFRDFRKGRQKPQFLFTAGYYNVQAFYKLFLNYF